jgi:chitodextrinase
VCAAGRGCRAGILLLMATVVTGACDKSPLMAPTSSTITVSAPTRVLASGGSAEIAAFVLEQSGPPVQNGITVVSKYAWSFGDGANADTNGNTTTHVYTSNGAKTATITTTDGRTATARAEFIISGV